MKKTTTFLIASLFSINSFAQAPSVQWQKAFGGDSYDYTKEVALTSDGGSIAVGYTESVNGDVSFNYGAGDCWVIKIDAAGLVQWEKSFGGSGFDYGHSIQQTTDGGYIIAGYSESTDGDITTNAGGGDCWIIKLDNSGSIEWQHTYGGTVNDNGKCIRQTVDGGYIVAGNTESSDENVSINYGASDCWLLKLDNVGMIEWEKTLGGTSFDYAQDIKQTPEGGYILCGGTHSNDVNVTEQNGNGDCWIVKLNNIGNIVWEHSFGGTDYDFAQSIELADGGYIIAGYSESSNGDIVGAHGGGDCWIIKCNSLGDLQWQKSLGGTGNDYGYSIKQLNNGGYILTGYSESNNGDVSGNHGSYDCWFVQLSAAGFLEMQKSFGGTGVDIGYSIRQISASSYVIGGYSESIDGDVSGNHGGGDSWIIHLNVLSVNVEENVYAAAIVVSPNPSSGNFNFVGLEEGSDIVVYDVAGKIIHQVTEVTVNYSLDMGSRAKGVYFYSVRKQNGVSINGKIILN